MKAASNEWKMNKPLNQPRISNKSGKKGMVYILDKGKKRLIHFGQSGAPDFNSGTATKAQQKSYLARSGGIKNKAGQLTKDLKSSPNFWSREVLWK